MSTPVTPRNSQSTRRNLLPNSPSFGQNHDLVQVESICTFVFMKCHVSDTNDRRLTELAMIAIHRLDIAQQGLGDVCEDNFYPRYKDSLVLTFDPDVVIQEQDSANSDLILEQLKANNRKVFDKDAVYNINGFLREQQAPICLLAHGGHAIDFKVLQMELQKLNMSIFGQNSTDLLCADTMRIFWQQDMGIGSPSVLDFGRYSLENVYRRFLGKFPNPSPRTAKFYALCLLEIFRKPNGFVLDPIPCRKFNAVGNNSEPVMIRLSPSKKGKIEQIENIVGDESPLIPAFDFNGMVPSDVSPGAIQTFAFVDLETTGLEVETDFIVELCMVAVHRSSLSFLGDVRCIDFDYDGIIPRVTDECSSMILPLSDISPKASAVNFINRDDLEARKKRAFTIRTANNLRSFLVRQAKPICLIAHNGWKFDFPMLDAHLRRTHIDMAFWNEVYCADSLQGLRELRAGALSNALGSVFKDLVGSKTLIAPPAHTAEGDVLRLIAITRLCKGLVQWLEQNKKLFRECGPSY